MMNGTGHLIFQRHLAFGDGEEIIVSIICSVGKQVLTGKLRAPGAAVMLRQLLTKRTLTGTFRADDYNFL